MRLNDLGKKYLREQLKRFGSANVVANLSDAKCWQSWIQAAIWARLEKSPDETVSIEMPGRQTKDGNPRIINLYDEHFFCGKLMRYADGSYIREATFAERHACDEAAENDNGVGAFRAEVDGKQVTVFVEN